MKIHHLGYAVNDLGLAVKQFGKIGYKKVGRKTNDKLRNVSIQFMKKERLLIEIIAPFSSASPVKSLLKKIGPTPYHLCYQVPKIFPAIKKIKKDHFVIIEGPEPAKAIGGKMVAFLFNKDIGLIELVEK